MKISGFSIIKNAVLLDYPVKEMIISALPVCDEFIVVVGRSEDGTRELIESIGSSKVKIIDTEWDPELRIGGRILAQQTNIGIDMISGDWGLYLQADELLHEKDLDEIRRFCIDNLDNPRIDGALFPYHHFWGYEHVVKSRRTYRYEIRLIRNDKSIRSYRDAQGFRKYPSPQAQNDGHPGKKLKVKKINTYIYAYSRVRSPEDEIGKVKHVAQYWHDDNYIDHKYRGKEYFDYNQVDILEKFDIRNHPLVMHDRVSRCKWKFEYRKPYFTPKTYLLYLIEKYFGWRIGEYRNYKLVK